jgi:hypothetical protein
MADEYVIAGGVSEFGTAIGDVIAAANACRMIERTPYGYIKAQDRLEAAYERLDGMLYDRWLALMTERKPTNGDKT